MNIRHCSSGGEEDINNQQKAELGFHFGFWREFVLAIVQIGANFVKLGS